MIIHHLPIEYSNVEVDLKLHKRFEHNPVKKLMYNIKVYLYIFYNINED